MAELIQHGGQLEIELEDKSRLAEMMKVCIDWLAWTSVLLFSGGKAGPREKVIDTIKIVVCTVWGGVRNIGAWSGDYVKIDGWKRHNHILVWTRLKARQHQHQIATILPMLTVHWFWPFDVKAKRVMQSFEIWLTPNHVPALWNTVYCVD